MSARRRSTSAPSADAISSMDQPAASSSPPSPTTDDSVDAALLDFHSKVTVCRVCPSIGPWRKFPLGRRGTARYRLMVLGEAPGRVSLENGRPFSNPRNLTVRNAFAQAVAPLTLAPEDLLYFSDTVKCWPASPSGANRSPTAAENATCVARHLTREIALVHPIAVFAIGARAAAAILGRPVQMAALHGTWLTTASGLRVLPLMHPSTINIAGMRKVGIRSLADYEARLATLFRTELAPIIANIA